MKKVEDYVRSIPDFPEKGIVFRDITSVLQDAEGLKLAIDEMVKCLEGVDCDIIAGAESRGFVFGMPIAYLLNKPFVMVRKAGKLPCETVSKTYDGTMKAAAELVEELGGEVVKMVFLIELAGLKGREFLKDYDIASVVKYEGA